MPIQPIDVQTLFMRLSQIGKEQSLQRESAHLAQTIQGNEMVREAEEQSKTVNESRDVEDGPEAIKDDQQQNQEQKAGERKDQLSGDDEEEQNVFRDPDLGNSVDISG